MHRAMILGYAAAVHIQPQAGNVGVRQFHVERRDGVVERLICLFLFLLFSFFLLFSQVAVRLERIAGRRR